MSKSFVKIDFQVVKSATIIIILKYYFIVSQNPVFKIENDK